jgi:transglycosylase-like protein with SLT domain
MTKRLLKLGFYSLPFVLFLFNFTERRAAAVSTPVPRNASPSLKVMVRKTHGAAPAGAPPMAADPFRLSSGKPNTQEVKAYVRTQAVKNGVDPQLALWIVKHESSFNPRARGDGDASRGLWQISRVYHPEVSDDKAYAVTSSTQWSLERIRDGKVNEWSSYRNCKSLYANCPY